jgi:hypothetical protein
MGMKEKKKKEGIASTRGFYWYSLSTATMKFILLTTGSILMEPELSKSHIQRLHF